MLVVAIFSHVGYVFTLVIFVFIFENLGYPIENKISYIPFGIGPTFDPCRYPEDSLINFSREYV